VDLKAVPYEGKKREDFLLFSESAGRIVVTVDKHKARDFESLMKDVPHALIGETIEEPFLIIKGFDGKVLLRSNIYELKKAWQKPFSNW